MRKNANFANHKYALRRILLINILKLKQLVSNLYHFAFGREVHTNGMLLFVSILLTLFDDQVQLCIYDKPEPIAIPMLILLIMKSSKLMNS